MKRNNYQKLFLFREFFSSTPLKIENLINLYNLDIEIRNIIFYGLGVIETKVNLSHFKNYKVILSGRGSHIDSLVYNYNTSEMYSYFFKKIIEKRKIDFISKNEEYIEKNPNSSLNIVRMLYMQDKYSLTFSDKVKEYIIKYSNKDYKKLYNAQFQHYHQEILEENKIKEKIEILIGE